MAYSFEHPLPISALFRAHLLFLRAFFLLLQTTPTSATTTTNYLSPIPKVPTATPKATPIYINALPAYSSLPACAEAPLSNIVRNMWSGCGDGSQLNSFSCFCTDSYSKFSWEISTAVVGICDDDDGDNQLLASSAVGVFHEYCTQGPEQLDKLDGTSTTKTGGDATSSTGITSEITSPAPTPGHTNTFPTAQTQTSSAMTNGMSTLYVLLVSAMAVLLDNLGLLVFI